MTDDFVRGFCLARAISEPAVTLASGELFAKAVQYAMIISTALMVSSVFFITLHHALLTYLTDFIEFNLP